MALEEADSQLGTHDLTDYTKKLDKLTLHEKAEGFINEGF